MQITMQFLLDKNVLLEINLNFQKFGSLDKLLLRKTSTGRINNCYTPGH